MTEKAPLWEPFYPASFSTPCVTPIFWGKPSFGSSRRTCQIRLICEWDLGLTCLTDPHRFEKILPFQTPRKSGPMGAGMGIRGCFLTPVAKASHRPIQAGLRGLSGFAAYWSSGFLLFLSPSQKSFSLFMRRRFCIERSSHRVL